MKIPVNFNINKLNISQTVQFLGLILATGVLLVLAYIFNILNTPVLDSAQQEFRIRSGASVQEIADSLAEKAIIDDPEKFILAVKIKRKSRELKAGYYSTENVDNYSQLISLLANNQQHTIKVTIPEGSTIKEISKIISPYFNFSDTTFLALTHNREFIKKLDLKVERLEGYLFPDTYYFSPDAGPGQIITKMVKTLYDKISPDLKSRIYNSKYSFHEILTLASIIEGECILDKERRIVSSLYHNRLNRRMHLNADPTIQYIIDDGPRRLLKKDLAIKSPYNTYKNYGLPPAPVNNPGLKSIKAAANPASTDYIYMVAKGNGEHAFTSDYDEFLEHKQAFQEYRQQVNNQ
jgi:UPF0755 protein